MSDYEKKEKRRAIIGIITILSISVPLSTLVIILMILNPVPTHVNFSLSTVIVAAQFIAIAFITVAVAWQYVQPKKCKSCGELIEYKNKNTHECYLKEKYLLSTMKV